MLPKTPEQKAIVRKRLKYDVINIHSDVCGAPEQLRIKVYDDESKTTTIVCSECNKKSGKKRCLRCEDVFNPGCLSSHLCGDCYRFAKNTVEYC